MECEFYFVQQSGRGGGEANAPNTIPWLCTCLDYESHKIQLYTTYHNAMFTACSKCTDHNIHVDTRSALTLVYSNIVSAPRRKATCSRDSSRFCVASLLVRSKPLHEGGNCRSREPDLGTKHGPGRVRTGSGLDPVGFGPGPDWTRCRTPSLHSM